MKHTYWTNFREFVSKYQNLLHSQNDIPEFLSNTIINTKLKVFHANERFWRKA